MSRNKLETAAVGPIELGFRATGTSENPALVLLHGRPHCGALYEGVLEGLAADRFVLAFDLPATGASRGPPSSAEKTVLADIVLQAAKKRWLQCWGRSYGDDSLRCGE